VLGPADEGPEDFAVAGLDRPHFTEATAPSISNPEDQANAAFSAVARSKKFTKAHLESTYINKGTTFNWACRLTCF